MRPAHCLGHAARAVMRSRFILYLLLCSVSVALAASDRHEFRMFSLQHRMAQDLVPAVQQLIGGDGSVSVLDNHLLVTTTPDKLAAIEQVVAGLDVARRNLRITVSHDDVLLQQRAEVGISGRGRVGDAEIVVQGSHGHLPRNQVELDINQQQSRQRQSGSEFISVLDGEPAFVEVGQSVPYSRQWLLLSQRHAHVQQDTQWVDISTGFAVRPRYLGEQVQLEITPRVMRLADRGVIDFTSLTTVVNVKPGQWFDLAGSMARRDEVSRTILQWDAAGGSQQQTLMIKVDVP